jgi:putative intracellular protease/amidase
VIAATTLLAFVVAVVPPPSARQASRDRPRRVALVLFDGIPLLELMGPAQIFESVPGFSTYTVAGSRRPVETDAATIVPDETFESAPKPDVILVTSGAGGRRNPALREWLRAHGPDADAVLSVCNGALLLANAGLLDGRAATCPTGNLDGLRLLGRDVHPYRGRRFVHDGNVVTCDSYFAGVDGALEVVKSLCGEAAARAAADSSLYDWRPQTLDSSHPAGGEAPPTHHLRVVCTLLERGAAAAHAEYDDWVAHGPRDRPGPFDPERDRFPFHILAWTLAGAGRHEDATTLCQWTVDQFPKSAFALSCLGEEYFESDRVDEALATLLEADALEPGEARSLWVLGSLLHDPGLVASEASRRARRLLREHASMSSGRLAPSDEPGERMAIRGVVRDATGKPIRGALVHAFHADASGLYTPNAPMDEPDARLFAWVRTDETGQFRLTSVRPGGYPQPRRDVAEDAGDARWIPQHVHFEVEAGGFTTRRFQLVFRDDPRLTPHWLRWAADGGHAVIDLVKDGAGTLQGWVEVKIEAAPRDAKEGDGAPDGR